MDVNARLSLRRERIDQVLDGLLPGAGGPAARVIAAMRYAVTAGGKRLRPAIALAACEACGGNAEAVIEPAAALELIHTYSLVHDDLPSMDDDDLRRGRPTVHRAFGEAEAILAGDALHSLAFEILATRPAGDASAVRRLDAVAVVAAAVGVDGMVGGQMADLVAERSRPDAETLDWIHGRKTAALLSASAEIGAIHAGADAATRTALARYGTGLGLAFQIADDVLDCTATAEQLGKTPGKDASSGKATYPALFGIEGSRRRAEQWAQRAVDALHAVALRSPELEALAWFAARRRH
jgi:geranylgeranyl diphosphate synthase type II